MSIGNTIGRGIGYSAAALVHGAAVAATATGQFGKDVATGSTQAYAEHSVRLANLRKVAAAQRPAAIAIQEVSHA